MSQLVLPWRQLFHMECQVCASCKSRILCLLHIFGKRRVSKDPIPDCHNEFTWSTCQGRKRLGNAACWGWWSRWWWSRWPQLLKVLVSLVHRQKPRGALIKEGQLVARFRMFTMFACWAACWFQWMKERSICKHFIDGPDSIRSFLSDCNNGRPY
jgi:hypothetical protein